MSDNITSIIDTLTELQRMHQLNFELLEQLHAATDWLLANNISLPNVETLYSLFQKSKSLLAEIQGGTPKILIYQKISDERKHSEESDGKVPVPFQPLYKGAIVFSEQLVTKLSQILRVVVWEKAVPSIPCSPCRICLELPCLFSANLQTPSATSRLPPLD